MNWTNIAAWAGFGLGIATLSWQIFTWLRKMPRLRVLVQSNSYFSDELQTAGVDPETHETKATQWITVSVMNVGELPTTVDRALISTKGPRWRRIFRRQRGEFGFGYPSLNTYDGKRVPTVLKSGETLRMRLNQRSLASNFHRGPFYVHVWTADKHYPLIFPTRFVSPATPMENNSKPL